MKALLLTFDTRAGFAELAHRKYRQLWPDCPLRFRLPRNAPEIPSKYLAARDDVAFLESPADIRGTMAALLADCDDDEWVFWCSDDRYPVEIPDPSRLDEIIAYLDSDASEETNGVKLTRWLEALTGSAARIGASMFRVQATTSISGFWHPHFLRAKVLKAAFLGNALPQTYSIRELKNHFDARDDLDFLDALLVPRENLVTYAEPCNLGSLTRNGKLDLDAHDCPHPDYPVSDRAIIFDANHRKEVRQRRYFRD